MCGTSFTVPFTLMVVSDLLHMRPEETVTQRIRYRVVASGRTVIMPAGGRPLTSSSAPGRPSGPVRRPAHADLGLTLPSADLPGPADPRA